MNESNLESNQTKQTNSTTVQCYSNEEIYILLKDGFIHNHNTVREKLLRMLQYRCRDPLFIRHARYESNSNSNNTWYIL